MNCRTWAQRARCRRADPELFFPDDAGGGDGYQKARAICGRCPVSRTCLAAAMAEEAERGRNHRFGMRGGLAPRERFELSRGRVAA